jgi:IS605 OrfB family transposase
VRIAHTWIKRAEVKRRQFQADAAKLQDRNVIPKAAKEWLDSFCEQRSQDSFADDEYLIRRHAIDGWDKVVQAWAALGNNATRKDRIEAARLIQSNLDDNDKFGDIQLFAGFGDDDAGEPRRCLADDDARVVWQNTVGKPDPQILRAYSAATVAQHNQRRFKVPAYRHPDPLRHPVFVDYGNSRWGINWSALKATHDRAALTRKLATAKDKSRARIEQQLATVPDARDLHGVALDLWTGQVVEPVPLRWSGKRLWKDLDLQHFGESAAAAVTRADRMGRAVTGQSAGVVEIAEVFGQKDWNGRLQVARHELDRLAELVYGKHAEPDFAKLDALMTEACPPKARKQWEHLNWFLTTSAKLKPQGPWLDYVNTLPDGIEYKSGRKGAYLDYAANKDRRGRARLQLARLPGLRVLSLDLGHRYAAACAVWETLSKQQMDDACAARNHPSPGADDLYLHLQRESEKLQKSGPRKGRPVTETTIYRRIGPDVLPDGTVHPSPWARLDRQFLIKLQGEVKPARFASVEEFAVLNGLREFVGLPADSATPLDRRPGCVGLRIDELQAEVVLVAKRGLRRLGDMARVAHMLTATTKPLAGGQTSEPLTPEQRIDYVTDGLVVWHELAQSMEYRDEWAMRQWNEWVIGKLEGPQRPDVSEDEDRSERKKRIKNLRESLSKVAKRLADPQSADCRELNRIWTGKWCERSDAWRRQLRSIRKLILPRIGRRPKGSDAAAFSAWKRNAKRSRQTGGLSVRRLGTIRELYQVLKAFRMRPAPENLRKNVPAAGDESLANFGRRILNQLGRKREQRIKQLASRIIEAALGVGSENRKHWAGRKRPTDRIDNQRFAPCHAVVVENLENYRPEETRLRRENRQLMKWAARNVRKHIVEGCQLYGLHFVEVSPSYTSRQDSRTGAPGARCVDVTVSEFCSRFQRDLSRAVEDARPSALQRYLLELSGQHCVREGAKVSAKPGHEAIVVRVPRRGGELFVPAVGRRSDDGQRGPAGLQADLNAAANIGLKALLDPDWPGAWWFVLVDASNGTPDAEKVKGCPLWAEARSLLQLVNASEASRRPRGKTARTAIYAWNPLHWSSRQGGEDGRWTATGDYWARVESVVTELLSSQQMFARTPW